MTTPARGRVGHAAALWGGAWRNVPDPAGETPRDHLFADAVAGPCGCRTVVSLGDLDTTLSTGATIRTRDYRAAANSWAPARTVTPSRPASEVSIGGAADGRQWVVWRTDAGAVQAARRALGGEWSAPVTLAYSGASQPVLGVAPDGGAAVAWRRGGDLVVAQASAAGAWTVPDVVGPAPASPLVLDIAAGDGGRAAVAWTATRTVTGGEERRVRVAATSASGWDVQTVLFASTDNPGAVAVPRPAVAVDGGTAVVVLAGGGDVRGRAATGVAPIGTPALSGLVSVAPTPDETPADAPATGVPSGDGGAPGPGGGATGGPGQPSSGSPAAGSAAADASAAPPPAASQPAVVTTPAPQVPPATAAARAGSVVPRVRSAVIGRGRLGRLTRLTAGFTLAARPAAGSRVTVAWTGPGRRSVASVPVVARSTVVSTMHGRLRPGVWTCTLRVDGRALRTVRTRLPR